MARSGRRALQMRVSKFKVTMQPFRGTLTRFKAPFVPFCVIPAVANGARIVQHLRPFVTKLHT